MIRNVKQGTLHESERLCAAAPIEKCRNLCYNRDRSEKWKMIHRDAQAAFYRSDFPKRRSPRRTRNRGDLPRDFSFGERILAAKTARKTDDFPKRLLSPRGTRAGDDRVPTHRMLRAALKHPSVFQRVLDRVPTHRMLRAALKHLKILHKKPPSCPNT